MLDGSSLNNDWTTLLYVSSAVGSIRLFTCCWKRQNLHWYKNNRVPYYWHVCFMLLKKFIIHAAMMAEQCCYNIVIMAKQHCGQRCSCCMASSSLSISCWPAQSCSCSPVHICSYRWCWPDQPCSFLLTCPLHVGINTICEPNERNKLHFGSFSIYEQLKWERIVASTQVGFRVSIWVTIRVWIRVRVRLGLYFGCSYIEKGPTFHGVIINNWNILNITIQQNNIWSYTWA